MVFKSDQLISISGLLTRALQNQPYYIDKLETEKDGFNYEQQGETATETRTECSPTTVPGNISDTSN